MRWFLFAAMAAALAVSAGVAQEAKKKDKDDSGSMKKEPEITEVGSRTLEQWIKDINSKDPSKREVAMRTVGMFGPDRAYQAVPAILAELKKHTVTTPIDLTVRLNGATALGSIIGGVKEPDPKHVKEAVAILKKLCKDEQAVVRFRAVQALPRLGMDARTGALNEVMVCAQDRDTWEVRQAGIQTLAILATADKNPPPPVLAIFYKALNDSSMQVRMSAVQALAMLGPGVDKPVQTTMLRNLESLAERDPEPTVQIWAHMGMMTIKKAPSSEHVQPVVRLLNHSEAPVRVQAAQALGSMGPTGAKSTTSPLIGTLSDPDPNVVATGIVALLQAEATVAVPALKKLADGSKNDAIKSAATDAATALSKMKDGAKKAEQPEKK